MTEQTQVIVPADEPEQTGGIPVLIWASALAVGVIATIVFLV